MTTQTQEEPQSSPRVLITGGAGFLGGHVAQSFREAGIRARLFDIAERPDWATEPEFEFAQGDIQDAAAARAALQGVEVVIHAAFASPRQSVETLRRVNTEACRVVCDQAVAGGARRVLLISSTIVQKPRRVHPFLADSPLTRLDAYRETRAEAERILNEFDGQGISTAIVRPKTFIGAHRVGAFALIFDLIRQGRAVPVLGSGRNRYQLLDIRDMARGIRLLADAEGSGVYYFGAKTFRTVREDLQGLIDHAGTGARLRFLPGGVARVALRGMELANLVPLSEWHYMSARGEDSLVDTSRAEQELGWQPQRSNAQALAEAYDWYVSCLQSAGSVRTTHPVPAAHRALRGLLRLFWG